MRLAPLYRNALLLTGLLLSGIAAVQAADWPRQITDSRGTHTLESQPQRIVSTSVTLTGSLLAIDAPVIASGATTPNNRVADDQGFLRQWSKVAKERKLQRLYIGEPSAEAVAAQMPDLILISATGGDSALALYDQLSTIAPTLIINYDDKSWQSLLTQLGEITGMRNKRQSGLHSLISNWRRRKSKSNYRRSRSLPSSIPPLHTVPISGRRNQHKGRCWNNSALRWRSCPQA